MKSVYLGQYTDEVANTIAGELERAKIAWSYKQSMWLMKVMFMGEWGTRLFVESERIDEARAIAKRVEESAQHDE